MQQTIYKNIAIGSTSAVGATTLLHELQLQLEPRGFTCISTGQLMRAKASATSDKKHPLAQNLSTDIHTQQDAHVRELLASGDPYVIEGWLAGYVARDIPHTLKVLVTVSDPQIKAERFAQREQVSIEEAAQYIAARDSKNLEFWKGIYGTDSFWDPRYYDLVLDTSATTPHEEARRVLERFHSGVL